MLETPLEVTEKLPGVGWVAVQRIDINKQFADIVGSNTQYELSVEIEGEFSFPLRDDTNLDELTHMGEFQFKVDLKGYYVLKNCVITNITLDANNNGLGTGTFRATDIDVYKDLLVHFTDGDKVVDVEDYMKCREYFKVPPESMSYKEFDKFMVVEEL